MSTLLSQIVGGSGGIPAEIVMLGGGGGGGAISISNQSSGGGGAGELYQAYRINLVRGITYTIIVGGPGAGGSAGLPGTNGTDSQIEGLIALGGGGGGGGGGDPGRGGGCAGGNGASSTASPISIPLTNSTNSFRGDPYFLGFEQRFRGTNGGTNGTSTSGSCGGGGIGASGPTSGGTTGGAGLAFSITGASVTYGVGGNASQFPPVNATANTGNGGQGRSGSVGAGSNGGSGVVIIAYPDTYPAATVSGTLGSTYDLPTRSGYRVYRFLSTGTIASPTATASFSS